MTGEGSTARQADGDAALIKRFQEGDVTAFERLVMRWDGEVLNLAYRLCGNADDACDIRQLTFVRVHRGLANFRAEAAFSTWLYRIVVNLCRDHLRSRESRGRIGRSGFDERVLDHGMTDAHPDPVERSERAGAVAQAVGRLRFDLREPLVLRHYHGMRFADIASVLGTPERTIRARVARAMQELREALSSLCSTEGCGV